MSVAKSLVWMGGTSLLGQIVTWTITIIVARLLTPEDYGLVALSGLFTLFAQSVSEMGVGAAVIQRREISPSQISALYTFSLLTGAGMTLVGMAVGPLMAIIYDDQRLTRLIAVESILFLLLGAKSMQRNILIRETRFDIIAKVDAIARVAASVCALGMAVAGFSYWTLAGQWLLLEFFQLLMFARIRRIAPARRINFSEIREVLSFGVRVLLRNVLTEIYNLADTAILGKLGSKMFLGAYGFAKQLTNIPFEKIIGIVNQVLYPYLSRNQSDLQVVRDWTLRIADVQALTIAPFYYLLYFSADEVIYILLGPQWHEAVFPLKVFCVAYLFKLAESYAQNCLTALGQLSQQMRYVVVRLAIIGGGMLVAGWAWGAKASILVWIVAYPLLAIAFSRILTRAIGLGFREILRHLRTTLIAHAALLATLAVVSPYVKGSAWLTVSVKSAIGAVVYLGVIVALDYRKLTSLIAVLVPEKKKP